MTETKFKPGDTCWARRGNPTEPVVILEVECAGVVHYAYKGDTGNWSAEYVTSTGQFITNKEHPNDLVPCKNIQHKGVDMAKTDSLDLSEIKILGDLAGKFLARKITPTEAEWKILRGEVQPTLRDIGEMLHRLRIDGRLELTPRPTE